MDDLIKKKLEIAKRAGELNEELRSLMNMVTWLENKKLHVNTDSIIVRIPYSNNSNYVLNSHEWDKGGTALHDALLSFINAKLDNRVAELNELIKVLQ